MGEDTDTFECEGCGEECTEDELSTFYGYICWTCADLWEPEDEDE